MAHIRSEMPDDRDGIREVTRLAFGRESESVLVDGLRDEGAFVASLVAVEDGQIVGHVLFTRVFIETKDGKADGICMAPVSVHPEWQSKGLGSALIKSGFQVCRSSGEKIAVVLGHPKYYPRFGFSPELGRQLQSVYSATAGDAWMAMELQPGALAGLTGVVSFPKAFAAHEPEEKGPSPPPSRSSESA